MRATCHVHLILDLTTLIGEACKLMKFHIIQPSPVSTTSSLLGPNILSTLFSNTLNLCSSLVWETKFHIHTKEIKL